MWTVSVYEAVHMVDEALQDRTLSTLHLGDCLEWMAQRESESIQAIVTDPPYTFVEYDPEEVTKMREGRARGIWRLPPKIKGKERSPLPRFTVLTNKQKEDILDFFEKWAALAYRVLVPGAHIIMASTDILSHYFCIPLVSAGFEKRADIIRVVQTLRGGDRPKNAEEEFKDVCVTPRSMHEPWAVFRKPFDGTIHDNLRKHGTGGLRCEGEEAFPGLIYSGPTRAPDRDFSKHPSLKPQEFMRRVVRAALPLGRGVVLDPFMGGGSTIAAAIAVGYESIGVELDARFHDDAVKAIPYLAAIEGSVGSTSIINIEQLDLMIDTAVEKTA